MTRHDTITFARTYPVDTALLWRAWTDPEARAAWASPAPQVQVEFLSADCRPGGTEVSICRAPGMDDIRAEVARISVEAPLRTVSTESVIQRDILQSVALITAEITGVTDGATLKLTVQLASIAGDMAPGYREGFSAALGNIAGWLADRA